MGYWVRTYCELILLHLLKCFTETVTEYAPLKYMHLLSGGTYEPDVMVIHVSYCPPVTLSFPPSLYYCSEVYPFFVIVLGLENILIIVKAVMSTPEEFEVKQRVAAGLSKEGRAISRNLFTLLLMLSMGMVFFNYTMKVRCTR